jgi:hypothetical protein
MGLLIIQMFVVHMLIIFSFSSKFLLVSYHMLRPVDQRPLFLREVWMLALMMRQS